MSESPPINSTPVESDTTSIDQLRRALLQAPSDRAAWKAAGAWLARTFNALHALVEVDGRSGSTTITPSEHCDETWEPICDALILKSRQEIETVTRGCGDGLYAVAVPMSQGSSTAAVGAVALALRADNEQHLSYIVRELLAYVRTCEATIGIRTLRKAAGAGQTNSGVTQAAGYKSLHKYAFAITNGLKAKLNCDEVAIGMLHKEKARLLSVSGMDSLHPRSPGSKSMQHAMEEAADAESIVVAPDNRGDLAMIELPLHQTWLKETNSAAVASIPLVHADETVGVIALQRADGTVFSDEELETAEKLVKPLASGLVLLDQANRSLAAHARESFSTVPEKWRGLKAKTRLAVMIALMTLVGWMLFGKTTYTLQVPCELVASQPVEIAVPFESRIVKAFVRPGDFVAAGQPLVEFDTTSLSAERQRLLANLKIAEITTVQALNANDIASAGRSRNEANAARAQIASIDEQLAQGTLTAPFDGYVTEGDVMSRVGETLSVGTQLLQVAGTDQLAVDLKVDEGGATYLTSGMTGEFSTLARPGEGWECQVDRVDAAATVVDGENIFMARAAPQGQTADWLRPGMQGIARIDAGSHPVWWVYLHGLTDWVRMQAWKL